MFFGSAAALRMADSNLFSIWMSAEPLFVEPNDRGVSFRVVRRSRVGLTRRWCRPAFGGCAALATSTSKPRHPKCRLRHFSAFTISPHFLHFFIGLLVSWAAHLGRSAHLVAGDFGLHLRTCGTLRGAYPQQTRLRTLRICFGIGRCHMASRTHLANAPNHALHRTAGALACLDRCFPRSHFRCSPLRQSLIVNT